MKTPMQELLEELKHYKASFQNPIGPVIEKIENQLLKREMAVIIEAFHEGMRCQGWDPNRGIAEEYYNETFNTKEK
jgi:uncharacterized protein YvpB